MTQGNCVCCTTEEIRNWIENAVKFEEDVAEEVA